MEMIKPILQVALFEPEIPPNTGNIIRLCANIGAQLHLIYPLGFTLDDKKMRRAGLDYHEYTNIQHHKNHQEFSQNNNNRIFACSTKATKNYNEIEYNPGDIFLFGPETRGLPQEVLNQHEKIRIPMQKNSRSLNLSNAVAIIIFEAWRQLNFSGT